MSIFTTFNDYKDKLFKREIEPEEIEAVFNRLDVNQFFNYLNNLYNPSELIRKIGGIKNLELLYKDSEIYAAWDKRQAALLDTKLVIESDSEEIKKFMEEQLLPHEFQLKSDFQWAVPYGYGVEQIIYDPDRSCKVIGFQKEEYWRFDPLPDLMRVKLVDTDQYDLMNKVLPYGKWVVTTHKGTYHKPEGEAMFERLIQPWIFRCNGWDLWMDFAKRFANGFMHAKISDQSQAADVRRKLEKAGKSAVLVTGKDSEISLIQATRDSSIYTQIDEKTIATMQKVILGETLTTEVGPTGSYGAAKVHNEVRWEKIVADIYLVQKSINETMRQIAYVCGISDKDFINSNTKSKLIIDPGLNQELATRDATLANQIKFTKKYYINNYGFREDDFEVTEQQNTFGNFSQKKKTFLKPEDIKEYLGIDNGHHVCEHEIQRRAKLANSNARRKDTRQLNEKEDTVAFLNRNGEEPISIEDLSSAILNSKSQKELDQNLNALFNQDNASLVDLLTESLYYSATKGALLGNPEKIEEEE